MAKAKRNLTRRRRVRKKRTLPKRKQITLDLIPISEEYPPDNEKAILTWEKDLGWQTNMAALAKQHIEKDIEILGYSRVRYWALLQ